MWATFSDVKPAISFGSSSSRPSSSFSVNDIDDRTELPVESRFNDEMTSLFVITLSSICCSNAARRSFSLRSCDAVGKYVLTHCA